MEIAVLARQAISIIKLMSRDILFNFFTIGFLKNPGTISMSGQGVMRRYSLWERAGCELYQAFAGNAHECEFWF